MTLKNSSRTFATFSAIFFVGVMLSTPAISQPAAAPTGNGERRHKPPTPPPTSTTPPATPNPNCTIIVPNNALSAAGLATPYQLMATNPASGPCNEANTAQSAFVQAAILDPATGAITIYSPLVIDRGTTPAIAPVAPTLPAGAIVALWFGFDGNDLTLQAAPGGSIANAQCVNGVDGSLFSQFAHCNAPAFFAAANTAIKSGTLKVPPLQVAADGVTCPTVRDFFIVDQDQSDNLPTTYLAMPNGRTAQNTTSNRAALVGATMLGNPSDNRLVDVYVDPVIGCHAWLVPDLANAGTLVPALATNEIQARLYQGSPVALMPLGDPMTQVNGVSNLAKTNAYRAGVNQVAAAAVMNADTGRYCRQLLRIAPARMLLNETALTAAASPVADAANTLYTFLASRFVTSYELLNCESIINQTNPVSVVVDATGVATSASIDQTALATILTALEPSKAEDDDCDSGAKSR